VIRILRLLSRTISTEGRDARFIEIACTLAVPVLLALGLVAVARIAVTPGEIYIGVMVTLLCAGQLALVGVLVPYVIRKRAA
jgi:hypothetical protein